MQNSNSSSKTVGIVVVIIIIVVGIWLMVRKPSSDTMVNQPAATTTGTSQTTTTTTTTSTTPTDPNVQGIQSSGNSNASLDQDSASIDSQMQGLSSDTTAANQTPQ